MLDYQWVSGSYIRDTKILLDHFLYLGRMGCLFDKVYAVASNQSHVITTALRKPPLYAKNGENRGFWCSVIISVHKYGTHTDLIWLIDLHSKFRFLGKLIMIHVCDVIRLSYKKARQKLIVKENSKMVIPFHFSSSNSSN